MQRPLDLSCTMPFYMHSSRYRVQFPPAVFRNVYSAQRRASLKNTFLQLLYSRQIYILQRRTSFKCLFPNLFQFSRETDPYQIFAIFKCVLSNFFQLTRQLHNTQISAIKKNAPLQPFYSEQLHLFQCLTFKKCQASDPVYLFRQIDPL